MVTPCGGSTQKSLDLFYSIGIALIGRNVLFSLRACSPYREVCAGRLFLVSETFQLLAETWIGFVFNTFKKHERKNDQQHQCSHESEIQVAQNTIPLKGFSRFQSRETLPKPDRQHAILWAEKQSEDINFRRRAQANKKALCERRTTSQTILTILDVYLGEFENLPILR